MSNQIIEFIKKVSKAELHLHIEGTLEPEHMFELAKRNNVSIPYNNVEEVKSAYNFKNLDSFLNIYYQGLKVLIHEKDFFDLTWAYVLKCKEDNIVHTEIFFDPQAHVDRGVSFDTVINGISKALDKANLEFSLTSKIIMCFLRHLEEESGFKILNQASTFWYHPHHKPNNWQNSDGTGGQVFRGLAGMMIVEDENTDTLSLPNTYGVDEIPLIIQDRAFGSNGEFLEFKGNIIRHGGKVYNESECLRMSLDFRGCAHNDYDESVLIDIPIFVTNQINKTQKNWFVIDEYYSLYEK